MDCWSLNIFGALALALGLTVMAGLPCTVLGQTIPYPKKECRALAYHLVVAGGHEGLAQSLGAAGGSG